MNGIIPEPRNVAEIKQFCLWILWMLRAVAERGRTQIITLTRRLHRELEWIITTRFEIKALIWYY